MEVLLKIYHCSKNGYPIDGAVIKFMIVHMVVLLEKQRITSKNAWHISSMMKLTGLACWILNGLWEELVFLHSRCYL